MHRHQPPGDEAFVHRPKPSAKQPAEQTQELHGCIRVHGEHLFEKGPADGEDGAPARVGARIGGSRLSVDERHFAEDLSSSEDGEALLAGAGDHSGNSHRAVDHDEEAVAFFAFGDDE